MSKDGYKIAIEPILEKFRKHRQTKFANSHNCSVTDVHIHNQNPVSFLVKKFKEQNGIKSRVFKSLTPEQQSLWISFYDSNKDLKIMTNEQHTQFHNTHSFNAKTGTWTEVKPVKSQVSFILPLDPSTEKRSVKLPVRSKIKQIPRPSSPALLPEVGGPLSSEDHPDKKPKRGPVRVRKNNVPKDDETE